MWVILAVIAALTVAGMVLVSEYQKQPTLPRPRGFLSRGRTIRFFTWRSWRYRF